MRARKVTMVAGLLLVLAVGSMVTVWVLAPKPERFTSESGYVTTLEEYHFTTNRVEYRYPKRRFFEPWLPKAILKRYEQAATKRYWVRPRETGGLNVRGRHIFFRSVQERFERRGFVSHEAKYCFR